MTIARVVTVLGLLTVMVPATWAGFSFVNKTNDAIQTTMVRHSNEDIVGIQKRIWQLEDSLNDINTSPMMKDKIREEIFNLRRLIKGINKKLGYTNG